MTKVSFEQTIRGIVNSIYQHRKERFAHPEGAFDSAGRWYPSERESCGGDGEYGRNPSRAWPYSYMRRCRTKDHCRVLVEAWLDGKDVPRDVEFRAQGHDRIALWRARLGLQLKKAKGPKDLVQALFAEPTTDEAEVAMAQDWLEEQGVAA